MGVSASGATVGGWPSGRTIGGSATIASRRGWHGVGRADEPGPEPGDWTPLVHHGQVIGAVLRTRPKTKPLFISTGHRVSLESAVEIVMRCARGYRLPEPTRLADQIASRRAGYVDPDA